MIFDFLYNIFHFFLTIALAIAPDWSVPTYMWEAVIEIIEYIYKADLFFPFITMIGLIMMYFSLCIGMRIMQLIFDVLSLIRGGGKIQI